MVGGKIDGQILSGTRSEKLKILSGTMDEKPKNLFGTKWQFRKILFGSQRVKSTAPVIIAEFPILMVIDSRQEMTKFNY